jgi:hypothetical protein
MRLWKIPPHRLAFYKKLAKGITFYSSLHYRLFASLSGLIHLVFGLFFLQTAPRMALGTVQNFLLGVLSLCLGSMFIFMSTPHIILAFFPPRTQPFIWAKTLRLKITGEGVFSSARYTMRLYYGILIILTSFIALPLKFIGICGYKNDDEHWRV